MKNERVEMNKEMLEQVSGGDGSERTEYYTLKKEEKKPIFETNTLEEALEYWKYMQEYGL